MFDRRHSKLRAGLAALLVWLGAGSAALACEVCYGKAEAPIIDGMNLSIVFMLATTYGLIGAFAAGFVAVRRKSLRSGEEEA